jgi:hypothetical protein
LSIVLFKNSDENNLPAFYLKVNKENMLRLSSLYGNLPGYHRCLEALYSPSPEYPAACSRDERQGEPRRSSTERRRVRATAQFHFDTPQLAAGSFIALNTVSAIRSYVNLISR